jgi:trehalose-6-phosphate synthase
LGADVLGFHTQSFGNNFIDTVGKEIESLIDLDQFAVTRNGHTSYVKPFPISVPFAHGKDGKEKTDIRPVDKKVLEDLDIHTKFVGLGVDRMDYTKGILERFKGVEFFLNNYPEYMGQFTFLQIAPPSREGVEKYRQFAKEVTLEAERINAQLGKGDWQPIVLLKKYHSHKEIEPLYRLADVCMVTSLHDGMNLVAKEFVAARKDEAGVLILSQFTGAAKELKEALIINPYSAEQMAEAIHQALNMSPTEQYRRMKKMRFAVKNYNIFRWAAEFIKAVSSLG